MKKLLTSIFAILMVMGVVNVNAQERISLQEVGFHTWDGWDGNAMITGDAECAWEIGISTGIVYGDPTVNNYADLTQYSKLYVTVTEGRPRVLFNRLKEEGSGGDTFEDSYLVDIPNKGWCTQKYQTIVDNVYIYDLKAIAKDYGFVHLHSIKGANWANVTVENLELETRGDAQPDAASNWMSVDNYSVTSGDDLRVAVWLENETAFSAFQCDVYLPEGISLPLNEEGDLDVTLNPERATSSHTISANAQSDGAIRIASYSSSNKLLKGNNGYLFYLNLNTDADVEGEKEIVVKNIRFSTADEKEFLLNDASGMVELTKYVPKNDFVLADAEMKGNETLLYPVSLTNESELAAFQCDIYLPEGLTLPLNEEGDLDVRLNMERATSAHSVTARVQADGGIRVAAYANPTKPFKGHEGVLFYLNLQADKDDIGTKTIEIKNIICSTVDASTVLVSDVKATMNVLKATVWVSSITLDKQVAEVVRGETVTLIASVLPTDADNKEVIWSSSDETVATVQGGVVTTLKVGEAVITATTTDGTDLSASCTITVKPILVSSVTLDKQTAEVLRGETVTLTATVLPTDADNTTLVWTSSDETVATVQDGVVTTLKVGEAVITATTTDGTDLSASCTITVKPILVSSVTLDKQTAEVLRGESVTLTATVLPADADNTTLVWTSSDETVATVQDGVVTTLKAGEAVIIATTTDGTDLSASCTVTVKPILVSSITLDKQTAEVLRDEKVTLSATVSPADADNTTLVWTSSDETVATVQDGVVTTLKVGEAVITATTTDGTELSASCTVTVKPILVSFIALDKQTAEVLRGETVELKATFFPEDADNTTLVWTSSDETVATVQDGVVTTLKSGRAVITVSTTDGSNLSSTCMVTVKPKYEMVPAEVTLETGETVQLSITDGEKTLSVSKFTWVSQDSKIASVNNSGLVTCVGEGITTVTAVAMDGSGLTATCFIIAKANSIDAVEADKTVQVIYYSATGEASDTPHKGLNMVKRTYQDGRVEVRKEICK